MTKFAFIVGHYKCGTTWLINLLSLHPDIIGLAETNLFKYVFNKEFVETTNILFNGTAWADGGLKRLPRRMVGKILNPIRKYWKPVVGLKTTDRPLTRYSLSLLEQYRLKRELLSVSTPEQYCRTFFGFFACKFKPKYVIEKSADHVKVIPKIKQVYPDSKLIAIYRDGRDFVISHKFYAQNMGLSWSFKESVKLWKDMIETQLKYEKEYDLQSFSYESLLNDTKSVIKKILNYLELHYDGKILEDMIYKSSFEFITGRKRGQMDKKSFYRKGVAGDWKNFFSYKDKEIFKKIAGDLLIKLGYEKDYKW